MNLCNLKMEEWDGTYDIIFHENNFKILLLHLVNPIELKEDGRRNLIAIDKNEEILWFAEPPHIGRNFGWFMDIAFLNKNLTAWYGGSVLVEINILTGEILKEQFIK